MTLMSKGRIMAEGMPAEMIQQVVKRQQVEIIEAMLSKIEEDKPYIIVMHKEVIPNIGFYGDEEITAYMYIEPMATADMDIEPIPQVRMVYKSPEDLHLTPSKSLLSKLKNCWKYLSDDSEGHYEEDK